MNDLLRVVAAHIEVVQCARALLETEETVNARLEAGTYPDDGRLISTARTALVAALKQLEGKR